MDPFVLRNLGRVATALRDAGIDTFVFVGGAAVGLLLTDPAAPEPRFTVDVDVVTPVQTRSAYYELERALRDAGHTQSPEGPICRWTLQGVTVDVMPMDTMVLGFSNRWYPQLIEHADVHELSKGVEVRVASPPFLLASKLEAYTGRGRGDARFSQDLEDVIILFDGRPELVHEIVAAPEAVRRWIAQQLDGVLSIPTVRESIGGHLPPDSASQARLAEVLRRMGEVANLAT